MRRALDLACDAERRGEVPVGAVILSKDAEVIGEGANGPVGGCDPTAHAEIVALRQAAVSVGNYRLTGCTLIVTLEPCAMCAGAISHARIARLIYGASDPKGGAVEHGPRLFEQPTLHHRPEWTGGLFADEAADLLRNFFRARRGGTRPEI
ncbi:MAG: tRNA adenosine(34) deaminase TadA [Parvularcula sp.]|nr:tRNA adenosine(34) deaminase TadA [Parvularcula sp.]